MRCGRKLSTFLLLLVLSAPAFSQESSRYYVTEEQLSQLEQMQKMQNEQCQMLMTQCEELKQQQMNLENELKQSDEALEKSEQTIDKLTKSLKEYDRSKNSQLITVSIVSFSVGAFLMLCIML